MLPLAVAFSLSLFCIILNALSEVLFMSCVALLSVHSSLTKVPLCTCLCVQIHVFPRLLSVPPASFWNPGELGLLAELIIFLHHVLLWHCCAGFYLAFVYSSTHKRATSHEIILVHRCRVILPFLCLLSCILFAVHIVPVKAVPLWIFVLPESCFAGIYMLSPVACVFSALIHAHNCYFGDFLELSNNDMLLIWFFVRLLVAVLLLHGSHASILSTPV